MPAKRRTPTKPQSADPQFDADGFACSETVAHAIEVSERFLTTKIRRFGRYIEEAARRHDEEGVERAGFNLLWELRLADPDQWRAETGRGLPQTVEEIRGLMEECGYSPDFIAAGEWTPREVGPVLLKRLSKTQPNSRQYTPAELASELCCSTDTISRYAKLADIKRPGHGQRTHRYSASEAIRIVERIEADAVATNLKRNAKELLELLRKPD